MIEMIGKHQRSRWAVQLRMKPFGFGWCVIKAGERGLPVSTFINEYMEEAARQDLQKDQRHGDVSD